VNEALAIALAAAVPLRIAELQRKGGPTDAHLAMARAFSTVIAEKGDILLFGGKKGEAAQIFNRLAEATAVMAFMPGGVGFYGMHWEARAEKRQEPRAAAPAGSHAPIIPYPTDAGMTDPVGMMRQSCDASTPTPG
jgi:hypothetical protein